MEATVSTIGSELPGGTGGVSVDRVFEHRDDPGRHARLLISRNDLPGGLPFPPRRETRQPCSDRTVEIAGRLVR